MGALRQAPGVHGHLWAKVSYGILFVVLLPLGAIAWAKATEDVVRLPVPRLPVLGGVLLLTGAATVAAAIRALWVRGGGLPMNPFPPPRRVEDGVYRLVRHPIYLGITAIGLGLSLRLGSASGLWLVTPVLTLGWVALVWGYEAQDLRSRFGPAHRTWLSLPPDLPSPPRPSERSAFLFIVVAPAYLVWQALGLLVGQVPTVTPWASFGASAHGGTWIAFVSGGPCVVVPVIAQLLRSATALRRLAVRALLAMAIALSLYLVLPFGVRMPSAWVGAILVASAWMAADAVADDFPRFRWLGRAWALAVTASWVLGGMDGPAVAASGILLAAAARPRWLWQRSRQAAEGVANSLRVWTVGPLRILSYAGVSFLSGLSTLAAASVLAGPAATVSLALAATLAVICSALWAQFIERGHALSRPFGFYGSVAGLVLGGALAPLTGSSPELIIAAFAAAGPLFLIVGRLRCLQQGCCHGAPTQAQLGIRYRHPLSRVTRMTAWRDVPLHATPVYSMVWNLLIALLLVRLWVDSAALGLLTGVTFILSGLGRFVEESYRGEPQTPIYRGLRLYQYLALLSILVGVVFTVFGSRRPAPVPDASLRGLVMALLVSAFIAFATGVDFPRSNRRFARLV